MKKVKEFLKKNWPYIVIGLLLIGFLFSLYKNYTSNSLYESLMNQYSDQKTNFEKQIKELENINKKAQEDIDNQNKIYNDNLKVIEGRYQTDIKKLNRQLNKQRNELVEEGNENPDLLLNRLMEMYQIQKFDGELKKCQPGN